MSDWSLPQDATQWLKDHIEYGTTILELGSGDGTFRLAEWFDVATVEHDATWADAILRRQLAAINANDVRVIHAPILDGWYDATVLQWQLPLSYSAIVVDGPPGNIGRWGFLEHLDMFNTDVPILFDDIHRPAERELAVTVANKLGKTLSMHLLTDARAFGVVGRI